jgi:hypothetical protein
MKYTVARKNDLTARGWRDQREHRRGAEQLQRADELWAAALDLRCVWRYRQHF